jgi:hypothetical protein
MPSRKIKQLWPEATLLKSEKKGKRFVLHNNDHIIKVYTHQAWKPLRKSGMIEHDNTLAFYRAKISCHIPLTYKKTFDPSTFKWVETVHYQYIADSTQSDLALEKTASTEILLSVFRLFCDIAQKGFFHTDANAANILISNQCNVAHIIDIEEVILSPINSTTAAALMIARFYNDNVTKHVTLDQIEEATKAAYRELKWDSYLNNAITTIKHYGNKRLSKTEKQHRHSLLTKI